MMCGGRDLSCASRQQECSSTCQVGACRITPMWGPTAVSQDLITAVADVAAADSAGSCREPNVIIQDADDHLF